MGCKVCTSVNMNGKTECDKWTELHPDQVQQPGGCQPCAHMHTQLNAAQTRWTAETTNYLVIHYHTLSSTSIFHVWGEAQDRAFSMGPWVGKVKAMRQCGHGRLSPVGQMGKCLYNGVHFICICWYEVQRDVKYQLMRKMKCLDSYSKLQVTYFSCLLNVMYLCL